MEGGCVCRALILTGRTLIGPSFDHGNHARTRRDGPDTAAAVMASLI